MLFLVSKHLYPWINSNSKFAFGSCKSILSYLKSLGTEFFTTPTKGFTAINSSA